MTTIFYIALAIGVGFLLALAGVSLYASRRGRRGKRDGGAIVPAEHDTNWMD